jgi:hypothetical protein
VLRPATAFALEDEWVRSLVPERIWAEAIQRAMTEFPAKPWILQERRPSSRVKTMVWPAGTETAITVEGELTLISYGAERDGRIRMAGVIAGIEGNHETSPEKAMGETRKKFSALAPCRAGEVTKK